MLLPFIYISSIWTFVFRSSYQIISQSLHQGLVFSMSVWIMVKFSNTVILLIVELLLNIKGEKVYALVHPSALQSIPLITVIKADRYERVFAEKVA